MKNLSIIFATVLFFAGATVSNAQDSNSAVHTVGITISTVALVDIKSTGGSTNIAITPTAPTFAGDGLSFAEDTKNSTLWLNYSSIVASGTRNITAAITATTLPSGLSLQLAATTVATTGSQGTLGTTSLAAATTLSSNSATATTVITGIGSCHTSKGKSKGSNLTYSVIVNEDNYASLVAASYVATVTYTITDEI